MGQSLSGPIGPIGPIGQTGLIGPIGPIGQTGETGPIGPIGQAGISNVPGPIGQTGAIGPLGPIGLTGLQGTTILSESDKSNLIWCADGTCRTSKPIEVTAQTNILGGSKIVIQNGVDGTSNRGIYYWLPSDTNWGSYLSINGPGKSLNNGTACTINGITSAIRNRVYDSNSAGFIWENGSEKALMGLNGSNGDLNIAGQVNSSDATLRNGGINLGQYRLWIGQNGVHIYKNGNWIGNLANSDLQSKITP